MQKHIFSNYMIFVV